MVDMNDVLGVLRSHHERGNNSIRASTLADALWPDCRASNTNGQVFNLSSGVAGRMLRKCCAVWEVSPRVWEIIPERLP